MPGPGTYRHMGIDKVGHYTLSKIPGSKASAWSPAKGKRFRQLNSMCGDIPPPGTYDPSDFEKDSRSYILSTSRNFGTRKYKSPTKQSQVSELSYIERKDTPGPGQYDLPSPLGALYVPQTSERGQRNFN